MPTLTPATIVPDVILTEFYAEYKGNIGRLDRAIQLVEAGHVERSLTPGLWLVRSASVETGSYRVANGCCNCPDTARVGAQHCKHAIGVRIFRAVERADVDADQLIAITVEPEDEAIPFWPTDGEPCALPPQCPRCHAEAAILAHADHLGRTCLMAELFGAEG